MDATTSSAAPVRARRTFARSVRAATSREKLLDESWFRVVTESEAAVRRFAACAAEQPRVEDVRRQELLAAFVAAAAVHGAGATSCSKTSSDSNEPLPTATCATRRAQRSPATATVDWWNLSETRSRHECWRWWKLCNGARWSVHDLDGVVVVWVPRWRRSDRQPTSSGARCASASALLVYNSRRWKRTRTKWDGRVTAGVATIWTGFERAGWNGSKRYTSVSRMGTDVVRIGSSEGTHFD